MEKLALQKENGKYLWFGLLAIGFNPETEMSSLQAKTSTKHINLGPAMFDKPNKDAFYIVTRFLLERLNPTRFNELYRSCWPILDHKRDAEFRKVTCTWLREIMDETSNAGSKVQASLFLSPGGPKFVSLMFQLANHVMLQEMKSFKTDATWVPEASALPPSSQDMAKKRLSLVRTRFLETAVDQDCFFQEYQRKAQALVKSRKDFRAESAKYDELLKRHSNDTVPDQPSLVEKATMVRALWSTIEEVVSSTQEEQHAVQCVLKGDVDQYALDGSEKVLKIPPILLERIQQLPHQLSSGNVYVDGQLNLLTVLELTNHALKLFKEEQGRVSPGRQTLLVPEQLQEKCQQMNSVLQDLHQIRQKISKEETPMVKAAIRELELEWDRKWSDVLQNTPLTAFLNEDPALGFMSPMAPLSFEPAPEASYKNGVFSQFPAKLLDKPLEEPTQQQMVKELSANMGNTGPAKAADDGPVVSAEASYRANTSLDWLFDGPSSPPKTKPAPASEVRKRCAHSKPPDVTPLRSRTEIIAKECDNLADQFADAVTTNSATPDQAKGLDLQDLLTTLHGDPFSTRKQLPRTPESLIMDVKSSWRKAVAENEAKRHHSNDSIMARLTPLGDHPFDFQSTCFTTQSHPKPMTPAAEDTSSVCQQRALISSNLGWDTFNTELMDSPSGTGSSAIQFSLEHETLPEIPSCDSLLSLGEVMSDEEVSPRLLKDSKDTVNAQQECPEGLFTDQIHASGHLLPPDIPTLDSDWLIDPVKPEQNNDKRFSLGFDALESPSTPKQDYGLPKLITFSPIDDMKC